MEFIQELSSGYILTDSWSAFKDNFGMHTPIILFMMIFVVVGAIDRIRGNKHGYGEKFEEGFHTMGPLALAMVGAICLVPIIKLILGEALSAVFSAIGSSPAMFSGILFATDAGGYPLAMELAEGDLAGGNFAGLIVGSTFGMIITALVPFGLSILDKEDLPYFSAGVLFSVVMIPIGCILGGLAMKLTPYPISIGYMMLNLIPLLIVAAIVAIGLLIKPELTMKIFNILGLIMIALITLALAGSAIQFFTGLRLPVLRLMVEADQSGVDPLSSGLLIVGQIALMLAGALPMITWISRTFEKPLNKLGKALGLNEVASAGLIAALANALPSLMMVKDMNKRGKVIVCAFSIPAGFVFGDHLSFTAGVNAEMIIPVIIAKLSGGILAVLLASKLYPKLAPRLENIKF